MIRRLAPFALVLSALAACGSAGENQNADQGGADTAAIGLGVTPDERRMRNDSAYVNAQQQLDSARAQGATPAQGIDSAAARGVTSVNNDPQPDALVRQQPRDTGRRP